MSASSSIEIQQPHGEDVEDVVRLASEATTPRTNLTTQSNEANDGDNDGNGGDMYRCFSYSSVNMTETEQGHESLLEPPAWKPPEQDEIDYTDAWNSAYGNNQSHFLRPFAAKDDSTIGSNQTNNSNSNSLFAHCGNSLSSGQGGLRPRGFSIHSNNDSIEISTQPQQTIHRRYPSLPGSSKPPQPGHHRQPSLPKNIFSTQPTAHHPLLPPTIVSTETTHQQKPRHESSHQTKTSDQIRKHIQSSTRHTPYEVNSSHHTSQVLADAAVAGLTGTFIDLYAIDRSVDTATATMLATKDDDERERKTALGTLHDVQCILDLYRVDKLADRFKIDLQMPLFMEEEAWVHGVYKDLRKIDVEMELHARRTNATEKNTADITALQTQNDVNQKEDFHFDLSDSDDEDLGGESILMKTESFVTEDDPYRFFDPHETAALRTNKYQASEICASTDDDLRDVIELLRTDVEIDGASRRHAQMEMIRHLLETDQEVRKWRERSALQEMWSDDLKALYAVDIEVDRAKTMNTSKQAEAGSPDVKIENTEPATNASQEVKEALARHIPNVSHPFCPTSPEPRKINVSAPLTSTEPSRRSVFQPQLEEQSVKKADSNPPKRSIFTQKEKNSAMSALRGASMMPGTTTVVTKGGEMIDDIPIGKIKLPDF